MNLNIVFMALFISEVAMSLHRSIRKYRVVQFTLAVFLMVLTWELSMFIMSPEYLLLKDWQVGVFVTSIPALIAGLFKTIELFGKKSELDDDDK